MDRIKGMALAEKRKPAGASGSATGRGTAGGSRSTTRQGGHRVCTRAPTRLEARPFFSRVGRRTAGEGHGCASTAAQRREPGLRCENHRRPRCLSPQRVRRAQAGSRELGKRRGRAQGARPRGPFGLAPRGTSVIFAQKPIDPPLNRHRHARGRVAIPSMRNGRREASRSDERRAGLRNVNTGLTADCAEAASNAASLLCADGRADRPSRKAPGRRGCEAPASREAEGP